MLHLIYYILIIFIGFEISSCEIITLHGPDQTTYTYDNSSNIGWGLTATVFKGL